MTLSKLLEIDKTLIKAEEFEALNKAERLWIESGSPSETADLVTFLETVLKVCVRDGVVYPPIFLARKKAIERRMWMPKEVTSTAQVNSTACARDLQGTDKCPDCNGLGYIQRAGKGNLCMTCLGGRKTYRVVSRGG
jgi:hypothetical protein